MRNAACSSPIKFRISAKSVHRRGAKGACRLPLLSNAKEILCSSGYQPNIMLGIRVDIHGKAVMSSRPRSSGTKYGTIALTILAKLSPVTA